jgi:hypothetical protein
MGLMVADGTICKNGCFRLQKRNDSVVERFAYLIRNLFNFEPKFTRQHEGRILQAEVSSKYISRWLRQIGGMNPKEKHIPDCIMLASKNIQAAFLKGLFEDGTVNIRKDGSIDHVRLDQKNLPMLKTLQVMLLRMGIVSSIGKGSVPRLSLFGPNIALFRDLIGFVAPEKNVLLESGRFAGSRNISIPLTSSQAKSLWVGFGPSDRSNIYNRNYVSKMVIDRAIEIVGETPQFLLDKDSWFNDRIETLEEVTCPSICVEVPQGSRFIQNGFDGWNSKGLEFNTVYLFNVIEGVLPHKFSLGSPEEIEEERRCFYVAATRAKDRLFIGLSEKMVTSYSETNTYPSRFLTELGLS